MIMHSLHEFTLVTQSGEYIVAILGLLSMIPFWKALNTRPRRR